MDTLLSHFPIPHPLPFFVHCVPSWLISYPHICSSVFLDPSNSDIPLSVSLTHFPDHVSTHSSSILVYTKSLSNAGFAVVFPSCTSKYPLPHKYNILTEELYVLLFVFKHIYSLSSPNFTDSRNSLSLIQSLHSTDPLVRKIQDWLFYLSMRNKSVRFCWVPSHFGYSNMLRRYIHTTPILFLKYSCHGLWQTLGDALALILYHVLIRLGCSWI